MPKSNITVTLGVGFLRVNGLSDMLPASLQMDLAEDVRHLVATAVKRYEDKTS